MTDTQPPLPEDILQLLDDVESEFAATRTDYSDVRRRVNLARDKYRPKPETLADHGTGVRWTRVWWKGDGSDAVAFDNHPDGLYCSTLTNKRPITPWPEIEGINPAELLNDGWQLRQKQDIPKGWHAAFDRIGSAKLVENTAYPHLIVFCRAPQGEDT